MYTHVHIKNERCVGQAHHSVGHSTSRTAVAVAVAHPVFPHTRCWRTLTVYRYDARFNCVYCFADDGTPIAKSKPRPRSTERRLSRWFGSEHRIAKRRQQIRPLTAAKPSTPRPRPSCGQLYCADKRVEYVRDLVPY